MPDLAEEKSIVGELRSITEKEDMRQKLRSKWGGYTKESVEEYLDSVRRQQQIMAETYSNNQQALYEEKEKLKASNDALSGRLRQVETEYRNLSEAMRSHELEGGQGGIQDVAALKDKIAALEEALGQSGREKSSLEQQIRQLGGSVEGYQQKQAQSETEKQSLREMLTAQMQETKDLRDQMLSISNEVEEKKNEVKFLSSMVTNSEQARLTEKVGQLTAQLQEQTNVLAGCNRDGDAKARTIEILRQENRMLQDSAEHLTRNLEKVSEQNDNLMYANQVLSEQLESEYRRTLDLIREKSALTVEKLSAVRRLEQAGGQIALLELECGKRQGAEPAEGAPAPEEAPEDHPAES